MQVSHCLSLAFPLLSSRRHCLSLAFPLLSSLRRCLSVAATQEIYQKCQPAIRPKDDDAAWAAADTFRCVLRCAEPLRCVWWLLCRVCCVLFWYMPCALLCVYILAAIPWRQSLGGNNCRLNLCSGSVSSRNKQKKPSGLAIQHIVSR